MGLFFKLNYYKQRHEYIWEQQYSKIWWNNISFIRMFNFHASQWIRLITKNAFSITDLFQIKFPMSKQNLGHVAPIILFGFRFDFLIKETPEFLILKEKEKKKVEYYTDREIIFSSWCAKTGGIFLYFDSLIYNVCLTKKIAYLFLHSFLTWFNYLFIFVSGYYFMWKKKSRKLGWSIHFD